MADNSTLAQPQGLIRAGNDLAAGWNALPARNKIASMVGAAAAIAILAAAWIWSNTPDYRVLFAQLPDKDGGAVIAALNQSGVPYKMGEGGTILVAGDRIHETRLKLASQGLPKSGVGFDLLDNQKFGTTQFQEQVNYQRALEGELTRSIVALSAVQSARVHLAIPKPSVFMREQARPTASVLVSLAPGRTLEAAQIAGITHLVSSSLPDLPAKNVSIIDQHGKLLSTQSDGSAATLDPTQLAYVQQIEQAHVRRIMEILTPLYGADNVRAQVSADIDFNVAESTSENFKPNANREQSVVRSQQTSESVNGTGAGAGVPGALSNQPPGGATAPIAGAGQTNPQGAAGGAQGAQSRRDSVTNYEIDKTIKHVKSSAGGIKRLSAAVVINHKKAVGAKPGTAPVPLPAEEIEKVTKLVRDAIGFSSDRGDSLNVVNSPFTPREVEVLPPVPLWQQPDTMATIKEVGKHVLIAAIVLYAVLGVLRPLLRQILAFSPPPPAQETAAADDPQGAPALPAPADPLETARARAKNDPRVVASVVRNWTGANG
ncbi:MAG: flagellar M-ring protein FliF [Burkholderiales bacterium]|nr:flagellar M-ring protein FliF [Burkholderiales bacterium]